MIESHAALIRHLDAAKVLLSRLEYDRRYEESRCPLCGGPEPPDWREPNINEGHERTCPLARWLVEVREALALLTGQAERVSDAKEPPCSNCGNEVRTAAGYLSCECPAEPDIARLAFERFKRIQELEAKVEALEAKLALLTAAPDEKYPIVETATGERYREIGRESALGVEWVQLARSRGFEDGRAVRLDLFERDFKAAALTAAPEPESRGDRLMLNEYGRRCWDAGHRAVLLTAAPKDLRAWAQHTSECRIHDCATCGHHEDSHLDFENGRCHNVVRPFGSERCACMKFVSKGCTCGLDAALTAAPAQDWQPSSADLIVIRRALADYCGNENWAKLTAWMESARELLDRLPTPSGPAQTAETREL